MDGLKRKENQNEISNKWNKIIFSLISLIAITFKLYQDGFIKSFLSILIAQILEYGISFICLKINTIDHWNIAKGEFLYYAFQRQNEKQLNVPRSVSLKSLIFLFQNMIFLIIVILYPERWNYTDFLTQTLNSFFCSLFLAWDQKSQNTFQNYINYIFPRFFLINLISGYFILCHNTKYFLIYDFLLLVFVINACKSNKINRLIYLYRNPFIEVYQGRFQYFNMILQNFSIFFMLNKTYDKLYEQHVESQNFISCTQIVHIAFMITFDLIFNQDYQGQIVRSTLIVYLILSLPYLWRLFQWMRKFLCYGPFFIEFKLDYALIEKFSIEELKEKYFMLNKYQKTIQVIAYELNEQQFDRILNLLLSQEHLKFTLLLSGKSSVVIDNVQKNIILDIFNIEFTKFIIPQLLDKKFTKYQITQLEYNDQTQNLIAENYQLIPLIKLNHYQMDHFKEFLQEIFRYTAFNKYIVDELEFSPQQIFYDLNDS